jgi:hypothetical protein
MVSSTTLILFTGIANTLLQSAENVRTRPISKLKVLIVARHLFVEHFFVS